MAAGQRPRRIAEIISLLTMEQHMEELRRLRNMAKKKGQFATAVRAEELRGRLRRFYVDQVEHGAAHEFDHMSDHGLQQDRRRSKSHATSLTRSAVPSFRWNMKPQIVVDSSDIDRSREAAAVSAEGTSNNEQGL